MKNIFSEKKKKKKENAKNDKIKLSKIKNREVAKIHTMGHFSRLLNRFNSNFSVISGGNAFVGVHSYGKKKFIIVCYIWEDKKFIKFGNVRRTPIRYLCYNTKTNVIAENIKNYLILHRVHATNKNGELSNELKKNVSFNYTKYLGKKNDENEEEKKKKTKKFKKTTDYLYGCSNTVSKAFPLLLKKNAKKNKENEKKKKINLIKLFILINPINIYSVDLIGLKT